MNKQEGFTIVELLVVIIITSMMSVIILAFTIQFMRQSAYLNTVSVNFNDRLNVADFFRQNLGTSSGMVLQNSLPDNNAAVLDPLDTANQTWAKKHAIPGQYGNSTDVTPLFYYTKYATDSSNNYIMNGTQPYQNEFVVFHDGPTGELRIRTIANSAATGNTLMTSCPETLATASCPADKILLSKVQWVDLRYFSRSGADINYMGSSDPLIGTCTTPDDPACNGLDFPQVEVAELKIRLQRSIDGDGNNTIQNSTTIRIALRNA